MAYSKSLARASWSTTRRAAIDAIETAHAHVGEVDGPGRPKEIGRPVAHAYLIRVVAEFQGFVRDLHDLAAERIVEEGGVAVQHKALVTAAVTRGRAIDKGNADVRSIRGDMSRLGIGALAANLDAYDARWKVQTGRSDEAYFQDLIELRNALAHGNQDQVDALRRRDVLDTKSWAKARLPVLDRIVVALDKTVWHHLLTQFGSEPW